MLFSSNLFLLYFFPVFLVCYFITPQKWKNLTALLFSLLFYAWGAPAFIFVVLGSIVIDYILINKLYQSTGPVRRRLLIASLFLNVGILLYFKYFNFFIENVNVMLRNMGLSYVEWMYVALPIGISFFTFQKISYSIDVYRDVRHPLSRLSDYALYIMLFPQMIAGPIVRFNAIADQIENRKEQETVDNRLTGFFRFVLGLSKKVLIANVVGEYADKIFVLSENELSTQLAWVGIIAYSMQVYFDFAGYSDMAIGIGRMIGFRYPENFDNPFISRNVSEFWRRWHITLGEWVRDYLYLPLAFSTRYWGRYAFIVPILLSFTIIGFWHGAAWIFILFGLYHGLFVLADQLFLIRLLNKAGTIPSIVITYIITLVGWVLFRTVDIEYSAVFIKKMFIPDFSGSYVQFLNDFWIVLGLAIFFSFFGITKWGQRLQAWFYVGNYSLKKNILFSFVSIILFFLCAASISATGFKPFIYFKF